MYRLNWQEFKSIYKNGQIGYSTLERPSGIHQFFSDRKELINTMAMSLEEPEELIPGLEIYHGKPIVALSEKASEVLRKRRARGKYTDLKMLKDDAGSIVIMGEPASVTIDEVDKRRCEVLNERKGSEMESNEHGESREVVPGGAANADQIPGNGSDDPSSSTDK